ncbi:MAG: DNA topoisomerase VI subunit B, partial [Methanothrix sp.]
SDVLARPEPNIGPVVARIMGNLLVSRESEQQDGRISVRLVVENHSDLIRSFKLHELLGERAEAVSPPAKVIPLGDGYDHHWKLSIGPGKKATISYQIGANGKEPAEPVVEGLEPEIVTGARVI